MIFWSYDNSKFYNRVKSQKPGLSKVWEPLRIRDFHNHGGVAAL
jgi:hypothetical protein